MTVVKVIFNFAPLRIFLSAIAAKLKERLSSRRVVPGSGAENSDEGLWSTNVMFHRKRSASQNAPEI